MQKLICKITFTPKADDPVNPNTLSSSEAFDLINSPLKKARQVVVFEFVNEVECHSSFEDLTQTAKITLPRKLTTLDGLPIATAINSYFRRGDFVEIQLGYQSPQSKILRTVFMGRISRIYFHTPIIIECQDEMYLLMQKHIVYPRTLTYQYFGKNGNQLQRPKPTTTKIKLKDLVHDVLLNDDKLRHIQNNFECVDVDIYIKYRFDSSVAKVLEKIKEEYGIQSYFREGKLHIGFESDATTGQVVEFKFEEVVIDDKDLNFQLGEDVLFRVRVESIDSQTNIRRQVIVGNDNGEQRDYKMMDASEAEMKKFANERLKGYKFTGYHGKLVTFGDGGFAESGGFVQPGDVAQLTSILYPEKNGSYLIRSVERIFGQKGYKQILELGARVDYEAQDITTDYAESP